MSAEMWKCGNHRERYQMGQSQRSLMSLSLFWFGYNCILQISIPPAIDSKCVGVWWWQVMKLTSQFSGWGLQQHTHGTHSVCSPIYENALSPDSWEAPACWSILLSCEGLVCEKGRCVQIWPLVTAGWPEQRAGLLTSSHIVHSAVVVVEILSELITSTIFLSQTGQLFSPDTYWGHLLKSVKELYYCRLKQLQVK